MHDVYKMIAVNLFLFFSLLSGALFYRYLYPKKKINLFALLLLISILPIISIFRPGSYESGDFNIHIYRTMDFYKSLTEGIYIPTWAGNLNATYGYPLFIFNYTFPYYILSLIHLLGLGYILSMKIVLASSFVLSGLFMFYFIKEYLNDEKAAFVSSIFYLFSPYHLVDEHFKVAIGELFTFTLLPLLFLFEYKLLKKNNLLYFSFSSLCIAFLIMSHAVLAFFSILLLLTYILFLSIKEKNYKKSFVNILSIALGSLASSFSWISPFLLKQFTFIQSHPLQTVAFPSFSDLIYAPWRFGFLFQGPKGEISEIIGYTNILVVAGIIFLLLGKKIPKKYLPDLTFWILFIFIILFLMTNFSKPIWYLLPFITGAGGHRLLVLLIFVISILSGYLALYLRKRRLLIYFIVFFTIFYTILNWGQRRIISTITDATLISGQPKSTAGGEGHFYAATKWVDPSNLWFSNPPKQHLEILNGKGKIKFLPRTSIEHSYEVYAYTPLTLRENTVYFPNWTITSNGEIIKSVIDNIGLIRLNLPSGTYRVEVKYSDIPLVYALKLISAMTFLLILATLLLSYLKLLLRKG